MLTTEKCYGSVRPIIRGVYDHNIIVAPYWQKIFMI